MNNIFRHKIILVGILFCNALLFGQDNIINQIAPGGKFVVRDTELNESLIIKDNKINIYGDLTIDSLAEGTIKDMFVLWNPIDKKLKIANYFLLDFNNDFQNTIQTSINAADSWTESNGNIYRATGNVGIGTSIPNFPLDIKPTQSGASILLRESDSYDFAINLKSLANRGEILLYKNGAISTKITGYGDNYFDGKVGIGTDYPSAKLEVAGQVKITGGEPGSGKVLTSDASGLASWQSIQSSDGNSLWIEESDNVFRNVGNVGVGTSNPSTKLEVAGQVKITGGAPGDGKVLTSDASGLASWEVLPSSTTDTLWTNLGDNVYRNNGNVGIGTNSPSEKLTVGGIIESTSGGYKFPDGTIQSTASNGIGEGGDSHSLNSADDSIEDALYVNDNGNVGIGTTSPSGILELNSNSGALIVPRMTTSQRDGLPNINGSIIYNVDTNEFNFLENDNWSAL